MAKTWHEKLNNGRQPHVAVLEKPYAGVPKGAKLLIATPLVVKAYIDATPCGEFTTVADMRGALAKRYKANATCPTSTGIFVRIVAEAALDELKSGAKLTAISPFWRIVAPETPAAKKISCGPEFIAAQRTAESKKRR